MRVYPGIKSNVRGRVFFKILSITLNIFVQYSRPIPRKKLVKFVSLEINVPSPLNWVECSIANYWYFIFEFKRKMLEYPWGTRLIPTSYLLLPQWPKPHNDEALLAMEESAFEDKVWVSLYVFQASCIYIFKILIYINVCLLKTISLIRRIVAFSYEFRVLIKICVIAPREKGSAQESRVESLLSENEARHVGYESRTLELMGMSWAPKILANVTHKLIVIFSPDLVSLNETDHWSFSVLSVETVGMGYSRICGELFGWTCSFCFPCTLYCNLACWCFFFLVGFVSR